MKLTKSKKLERDKLGAQQNFVITEKHIIVYRKHKPAIQFSHALPLDHLEKNEPLTKIA